MGRRRTLRPGVPEVFIAILEELKEVKETLKELREEVERLRLRAAWGD